jgi:mRNA interferase MazF
MVMQRGEVFWVDLGAVSGSVPAKRRPVVVLQSNSFNRSLIATVVVAAITSNTAAAEYPGNVFIPASTSGLAKDSVVNVSQLVTLDRASLVEIAGAIPPYLMAEVDAGLRLVLGI